jgi:hypothetical protein
MKRTILIAVIAALVAPVWAQSNGSTPDGFNWQLTKDKKGVILGVYTGTATVVRIPDKLNSLPVVEIEPDAFSPMTWMDDMVLITSVVIPSTVTKIGDKAFWGQTKLTSVTFSSGLIEIGASAFRKTAITSISLPATIKTIGNTAFRECTALTTVSIPAAVATITFGTNVFQDVTNLNAVTVQALTNRGYKF